MGNIIKVLIVDDEVEILKTIEQYLSFFEGIELMTASSFESAQRIINDKEPNVVITDVNLGDGNGLELIQISQKYTKANQVIVITGVSDTTRVVDALELGAVDYIKKPLDMNILKQRLDEACSRYGRWHKIFTDELQKPRLEFCPSI